ncbi:ROK family protein [Streptomyces sp. NPDC001315]|uniref:ROK family protein n=1 Tax=Streptomyces sp. NPDC001315 TaxID=3364562 RepID=UPI003689F6B1
MLAGAGSATRPQLAALAGLSKPTVSAAVAELERTRLAARSGTAHGATGRSAALYRLGPAAGCVLAIDLGSTHTAVRACALDGTILAARTTYGGGTGPADSARAEPGGEIRPGGIGLVEPGGEIRPGGIGLVEPGGEIRPRGTGRAEPDSVTRPADSARATPAVGTRPRDTVRAVLDELDPGTVRAVVIAVPDVVREVAALGPRPATPAIAAAVDALDLPPGVAVHIENNVNCAALAELHEGAARGRHTFGYLQVGHGIGLGIVVGGQVLRGAGGAAGEIARLPYPWAQGQDSVLEGMEEYAGAGSLMRRVAAGWSDEDGPAPRDAAELFALAGDGHATARRYVDTHAREVGRLAAATTAVLDPGLIVLGGGIGANPRLLPGVRAELARLSWPTEVVGSEVGDNGTVAGAARLAVAGGIQTVTQAAAAKD